MDLPHKLGNQMPPHLEPRDGPPPHTPSRRVLKLCFFPLNTTGTHFMEGKSASALFIRRKSSTITPRVGLSREGKKGRNNLKST